MRGFGGGRHPLRGNRHVVDALGGGVVVLYREAGRARPHLKPDRFGYACGVLGVAAFAIGIERQVGGRTQCLDVRDQFVAADVLVVLSERPREAGTRGGERFKPARREPAGRADVQGFGITKTWSRACRARK